MALTTKTIIIYLLAVTIITFFLFGIDKLKAKKGWWRINETHLLAFAVLGGSIGAWLGMKVWHHKTMHKKFIYGIPTIFFIQVTAVIAFMITSCSNKTTMNEVQDVTHLVGAYTQGHQVGKEELALFNSAYKGEVALTPVTVSTQVVAGVNYKYICKDRDEKRYEVVIYKQLPCYGGGAEVTSIKEL